MSLILQIIICILCIFAKDIHSNEIDSFVKSVCSESKSCSEEGNAQLPLDSCCRTCECDDICFEKRTCCPDKFANSSRNVTEQVCLPSVSYTASYKDFREFPTYFVRAKCPATYQDEDIRKKCEENEPESILDIPFVSSKDGAVIYKNRHCAKCFREQDIISWGIMMDWFCIKNTFFDYGGNYMALTQTSVINVLLKQCSLPFVRPKSTSWKHTYCYEENRLISSCPKSKRPGIQTSDHNKLKEKCENDQSALTFVSDITRFAYYNVYCYICNNGLQTTGKCNKDEPFKLIPDLSIILRTGALKDEQTNEPQTCSQYEYHDKYFDKCRILQCPILRFAKQGKCVSLINQRSSKLNFRLDFKVFSTLQDPQNDDEIQVFATLLPNLLRNVLQFQNCDICSIRVSGENRNKSTTEIYSSIILTTTPKCVEGKILSTAATLQDNQMVNRYKVIPWKQEQYTVEYIPSTEVYRKLSQNAKTIHLYGKARCQYLFSSRFENCAKIYLSSKEFEEITNKTNDARNVPITKLKNNGQVEICISNFEAMTSAKYFSCIDIVLVVLSLSSAFYQY